MTRRSRSLRIQMIRGSLSIPDLFFRLLHERTMVMLTVMFFGGMLGSLLVLESLSTRIIEMIVLRDARIYVQLMTEDIVGKLNGRPLLVLDGEPHRLELDGTIPNGSPLILSRVVTPTVASNMKVWTQPADSFEAKALEKLRLGRSKEVVELTEFEGVPCMRFLRVLDVIGLFPRISPGDARMVVIQCIRNLDEEFSTSRGILRKALGILATMILTGFAFLSLIVTRLRRTSLELNKRVDELGTSEARIRIINERLVDARDEALGASRAKSAFLANMSHELRTPLNAIIGFSEMLIEDTEDDELQEMSSDLQKILASGKHLLALINDILDLSKIEAGKVELLIENFKIRKILSEVGASVDQLLVKNKNSLELEVSTHIREMRGDVGKLRQVLINLLSNASKFTQNGLIKLTVTSQTTGAGDWILFEVRDSGIGMSNEQMEKLFTSFTQASPDITQKYGGTGLGLAISQKLCNIQGGHITVESEEGTGSVFTIRLPRVAKPKEGFVVVEKDAGATLQENSPISLPNGVDLVILADDDPNVHELTARILERENFYVRHAMNGQEALDLARDSDPIAILLDIEMPVKDGRTTLRELKSDEALKHIPVVVISVVDQTNEVTELGAIDFLTKPIDREQLIVTLNRCRRADKRRQVLVLEDDSKVLGEVCAVLEREGCNVIVANDKQSGLDRVALERPDLIVLDIMLRQTEGFEFVRDLRQVKQGGTIPVIVLTGEESIDNVLDQISTYFSRIPLVADPDRIEDPTLHN